MKKIFLRPKDRQRTSNPKKLHKNITCVPQIVFLQEDAIPVTRMGRRGLKMQD